MARVVEVDGLPVTLLEVGEPESPPLLFWHGSGEHARSCEQSARVLADEDGLLVLAPDAPGHGRTPPLPYEDYLPSHLAVFAAHLLDVVGIASCVWCGFSWGASVGCRFAAQFPERTRALALLEGGHVDFGDLPGFTPPQSLAAEVAAHGLDGALRWGLVQEPATATYSALRAAGTPVLLVTAERAASTLPFDAAERLRAAVPQAVVERLDVPTHELLAHRARDVARVVGDWLASRDLV